MFIENGGLVGFLAIKIGFRVNEKIIRCVVKNETF